MQRTIVAIGEVLWDMFASGPQFGGAPANFACTVARLGGKQIRSNLISAIGRDELGSLAIQQLQQANVETRLVTANNRPTGKVLVTEHADRKNEFRFAEDPAWDHLSATPEAQELVQRADVICFGTLAQRSTTSRIAVQQLVAKARPDCLRILDINLRDPHWSNEVIVQSLELANVLKFSDEEIARLSQALQVSGDEKTLLTELAKRFNLQVIALTRGANGSTIITENARHDAPAFDISGREVGTVGAGDAFTAALALGLLHHLPIDRINRWASRVAGEVCTHQGATPVLPVELDLAHELAQAAVC